MVTRATQPIAYPAPSCGPVMPRFISVGSTKSARISGPHPMSSTSGPNHGQLILFQSSDIRDAAASSPPRVCEPNSGVIDRHSVIGDRRGHPTKRVLQQEIVEDID